MKSLKIQQQEMEEWKKQTCLLVLYHSVCHSLITIPFYQLISLELQEDTYLDFWQGEWTTIDIHTVITIENGQRVLLHLCPSLCQELIDCPSLDNELCMQPKH
ncbi:hypothetical protein L208DRAFT_1540381 [Tricholoma matsutake]|nr:hypothetical protein L208DRAFT_1540381 [Tricholoma matsutake 945]